MKETLLKTLNEEIKSPCYLRNTDQQKYTYGTIVKRITFVEKLRKDT